MVLTKEQKAQAWDRMKEIYKSCQEEEKYTDDTREMCGEFIEIMNQIEHQVKGLTDKKRCRPL